MMFEQRNKNELSIDKVGGRRIGIPEKGNSMYQSCVGRWRVVVLSNTMRANIAG